MVPGGSCYVFIKQTGSSAPAHTVEPELFFFFFPLSRRMPCPKCQQSKSEVSETGERSREAAGAGGGGGGGMTWLCDFQTHLTSAPRAGHGRARSLPAGPLRSSFQGTWASVRASRSTPLGGDKPQQ